MHNQWFTRRLIILFILLDVSQHTYSNMVEPTPYDVELGTGPMCKIVEKGSNFHRSPRIMDYRHKTHGAIVHYDID